MAVLLAKYTGLEQYREDAIKYFSNWLPGPQRTVPHTPGGIAYRTEWGVCRYASNTAMIAMYFADYMRTLVRRNYNLVQRLQDPLDPHPRPKQFKNGTYSFTLFSYATQQLNYILGDNPLEMSYVVGFGQNYPLRPYHSSSFNPQMDWPTRGNPSDCRCE